MDAFRTPEGKVQRPGSLQEFLRAMRSSEGTTPYQYEDLQDEYVYRDARLALMDRQGVGAAVVFPNIAITIESFIDDTDVLYATSRAFNTWFDEEWGWNFKDRIFAPAWISLRDVDRAVEEVERVLARGARIVVMRGGPANGRSPADPHFDPVWARLNEASVAVAFHISDYGYNRDVSHLWGEDPEPPVYNQSAWQFTNTYCDRPIMDTLSALVFGNLFGRFPNLTVASVEHGAEWLPYLVRRMDKMRGFGRNGPWIGGPLKERPSAIFKRHVVVTPFPEDDIQEIVGHVGVDSIALGSDFPHPEGLANPRDYAENLGFLSDNDVRRVMRDNGRRLVGLSIEA
jgi:predicted TIM-barrel fold metal-dependent hydrolase